MIARSTPCENLSTLRKGIKEKEVMNCMVVQLESKIQDQHFKLKRTIRVFKMQILLTNVESLKIKFVNKKNHQWSQCN